MNNLAKYRGKHGMSQTQLGNKLNVTKACISYMEKHHISKKQALACAKVLNENVFNILGYDVLTMLPESEEDKKILVDMLLGM